MMMRKVTTILACTLFIGVSAGHSIAQNTAGTAKKTNSTVPAGFQGRKPLTDDEKEKNRIRLGITVEQQMRIEQLSKENGDQRREVMNQMREKQKALYLLYDEYRFDREKVKAITEEINGLHRRFSELMAENEEKMRRILNKEQFGRLRAMMKEMWEQRRLNRGPGGPGGPGRPTAPPPSGPPPGGRPGDGTVNAGH